MIAICSFGRAGYAILRETPLGTRISVSVKMPSRFFSEDPIKVGFHIHEFGDVRSCKNAGDHYNPHGKTHGDLNSPSSHLGDLGNLTIRRGVINQSILAKKVRLSGKYSIIGRSLVIHSREDDLGLGGNKKSLETGNSGPRILCGVIALANPKLV